MTTDNDLMRAEFEEAQNKAWDKLKYEGTYEWEACPFAMFDAGWQAALNAIPKVESEPIRFGLGNKHDGKLDIFSAIYRTKEQAQLHIDSYGDDFDAIIIPLYTTPQDQTDSIVWLENLLEVAICPECNGSGIVQSSESIHQCKWCYDRDQAMKESK